MYGRESREAAYLCTVRGWRWACDERSLTVAERRELNGQFLDYIVDDLMPWHNELGQRDFSLLEVNTYCVVTVCVCVCVSRHYMGALKSLLLSGCLHVRTCIPLYYTQQHEPFYLIYRVISNIRGVSRETLVAIIANIESCEWRREYLHSRGLPEEHHRASTTDDIEC